MGYLSRQERVDLTLALLKKLNDQPQTLSTLATELGKSRDVLWHVFKRLKKAKMVDVIVGIHGGIKAKPGASYDEAAVRTALGYSKPAKFHTVECNLCDEKKKRKLLMNEFGKAVFIDERERKWAGKKCPDCVELALAEPNNTSCRKCRSCGNFLPASRYFKCYECQPSSIDIDDDYTYHLANTKTEDEDEILEDNGWGIIEGMFATPNILTTNEEGGLSLDGLYRQRATKGEVDEDY